MRSIQAQKDARKRSGCNEQCSPKPIAKSPDAAIEKHP